MRDENYFNDEVDDSGINIYSNNREVIKMTENKEQPIGEEVVSTPMDQMEMGEPKPALEAKEVEVIAIEFPTEDSNKPMQIITKHPDRDETLNLTGVKYELDNKIKETGLWVKKDESEPNKLKFNNAVKALMDYYKITKLKDLIGKKLQTTQKENGYLVIKAY